jgi:hypothetical protein
MLQIELEAVASQTLSVQLDNSFYDIAISEANGCMCVTITRGNIVLVSGLIIVAGTPLLPYGHLENGNFILLTLDDDLPYFTKFGDTQFLIYASQEELDAINAAA